MPRQPLKYIRQSGKIRFPANALSERPELAALIGECIALWSQVEAQLAILLGAIMKAETAISSAVFLSIRNSRSQKDAMSAAAQVGLDGRELEIFSAIAAVYESLDGQRTDLAHGIFAVHEEIPQALLWVNSQKYTQYHLEFTASLNRGGSADVSSFDQKKIIPELFVYRKNDLISLRDEIRDFWLAVLTFGMYLRSPSTSEREFQSIYETLAIQSAISRLRAQKK